MSSSSRFEQKTEVFVFWAFVSPQQPVIGSFGPQNHVPYAPACPWAGLRAWLPPPWRFFFTQGLPTVVLYGVSTSALPLILFVLSLCLFFLHADGALTELHVKQLSKKLEFNNHRQLLIIPF